MITRLSSSAVTQGLPKYRSMLAGNEPFAFYSLASASGNGTASITFSNIPQTYKHLQIRIIAKNSAAAGGIGIFYTQFNGDSTYTNYRSHILYGNGTSALTNSNQAVDRLGCEAGYLADTASTNLYAATIVDIHDYASTTKNKTIRSITGYDGNASGNEIIGLRSGAWFSNAAITSIKIETTDPAATFFNTGSRFSLYGIK